MVGILVGRRIVVAVGAWVSVGATDAVGVANAATSLNRTKAVPAAAVRILFGSVVGGGVAAPGKAQLAIVTAISRRPIRVRVGFKISS